MAWVILFKVQVKHFDRRYESTEVKTLKEFISFIAHSMVSFHVALSFTKIKFAKLKPMEIKCPKLKSVMIILFMFIT